jgi:hypothetical protein
MKLTDVFDWMRRGKVYLISNSSLGWWAAQLAYEADTSVYFPAPWFKDIQIDTSLFPANWIEVVPSYEH